MRVLNLLPGYISFKVTLRANFRCRCYSAGNWGLGNRPLRAEPIPLLKKMVYSIGVVFDEMPLFGIYSYMIAIRLYNFSPF